MLFYGKYFTWCRAVNPSSFWESGHTPCSKSLLTIKKLCKKKIHLMVKRDQLKLFTFFYIVASSGFQKNDTITSTCVWMELNCQPTSIGYFYLWTKWIPLFCPVLLLLRWLEKNLSFFTESGKSLSYCSWRKIWFTRRSRAILSLSAAVNFSIRGSSATKSLWSIVWPMSGYLYVLAKEIRRWRIWDSWLERCVLMWHGYILVHDGID